ncbi:MAG: DUF1905 domain-containing protein [Fimbriimonadaceae bacterium]|nr:DUF1905 domain-containing protein [Fimbriimonadaceae bacterium]
MEWKFCGEAIEWRGPAPFVFVPTPAEVAAELSVAARHASYGWGCLPVIVQIGETEFRTSLIPRNGTYFVPIKLAVQRSESVRIGQPVGLTVRLAPPRG